ncbi:MAG: polysaccharide deacetylase family protein, partial [Lachnospiraceae bacterium]|nr:polysaccharide deacetylase family protein [Lachnospiraceae bacterium]
HDHYNSLTAAQIVADIQESCGKIESVTGCRPTLIRCPYGEYDDHVISAVRSLGMEPIQWDVDSLDWKDYGVDSIIKTVTEHKHLGNGSIILCHNGAKYTAQALDTLITKLKEKGYTFVPVSELIYRDGYHMNVEGRQIKN